MSKCLEKYGNEWSASTNENTRDMMETNNGMMMKHIAHDFSCVMFSNPLSDESQSSLVTEADKAKQFFLFKFETYRRFNNFEGLEFYKAYDSASDLIDDGWAVD